MRRWGDAAEFETESAISGVSEGGGGSEYPRAAVLLEKAHSGVFAAGGGRCPLCRRPRRQQGVKSAFTFGENYGAWQGALTALPVVWRVVRPQVWQAHYAVSGRGRVRKRALRDLAKAQYPEMEKRVTLATCDALLMLGAFSVVWPVAERIGE